MKVDTEKIKQGVRLILEALGEDLSREGIKGTPDRIARMYADLLGEVNAYTKDREAGRKSHLAKAAKLIEDSLFQEFHKELVIIRNVPFYAFCEHHLLPFFGHLNVGYIPSGKVPGLSKVIRGFVSLTHKPQVQERLTSETADLLSNAIRPLGVGCIIEARHLCLEMRGVQKPGTIVTTSALRGIFHKNAASRQELLTIFQKD